VTARSARTAPRSAAEFGLDLDRFGPPPSAWDLALRRWRGRYVVDAFGADPSLQDMVIPLFERALAPSVLGGDRIPDLGPAVLVANRGSSGVEPGVLVAAVRAVAHRRLRVVGYADLPALGETARRLGAVRGRPEDVAGVLRAGHLAAILLSPTRTGVAGSAPVALFGAAVGCRVLPVGLRLVREGVRLRWRVTVGPAVEAHGAPGDPLAAAELAEAARLAVGELLA